MKANKNFSQENLVADLYELYQETIKGTVDPRVTSAAVGGAREIGKLLRLKMDQQALVKKSTKRKAA